MKTLHEPLSASSPFLSSLKVQWKMVVSIVGVVGLVAGIDARRTPNLYEARVRFLVSSPRQLMALTLSGSPSEFPLETFAGLAVSREIFQKVIEQCDLRDQPGGTLWSSERMAGVISAEMEREKRVDLPLLKVRFVGSDPAQLKKIADAWTERYVEQVVQVVNGEAVRSYAFMQEQFDKVKRELAGKRRDGDRVEVARWETVLAKTVERLAEFQISKDAPSVYLQPVEKAAIPREPIGPRRVQRVLKAMSLAGLLGAALAILRAAK